jgi:hypothetical protein
MNPPTIGHAEVFKTLAGIGGDYFIFLSQSQDKKENPLSYEDKINFVKSIHTQYADHIIEDRNLNTVVKVASYLYDQGYKHATFVAGSDRLDQFKSLLTQYNGVEGKAHGYYKFELLDFKSSGERDPDSPGVSGISASKAREAAANNDLKGFQEATGAGEIAKEMFDAVRQGLGIKESLEEIDRRGFLKGLGAAALAGTGMSAKASQPLPVMATIKIKLPDGSIKTIKKDLGHAYDFRLDDAKKDLENILDSKGIRNYTIHLDRYENKSSDNPKTVDVDYIDRGPATNKTSSKNYLDKSPYSATPSKTNYLDRSKNKEFRDMDNY